jgi:hypothetical protein
MCEQDTRKRKLSISDDDEKKKTRRIFFSENSFVRFIESSDSLQSEVGHYKEETQHNETERTTTIIPEAASSPEGSRLEATESLNHNDAAFEAVVKTKTEDGPSAATIATQRLIRFLIKNRSITVKQVAHLLNQIATENRELSGPKTDILSEYRSSTDASEIQQMGDSSNRQYELTMEVIRHLQSIGDRIETRGKASLLPCTSNLGKPFLPAIRFLIASASQNVLLPSALMTMVRA